MSTLHRELCGIVSALQTYEGYIIGSPFPIHLHCDHEPMVYLWGRKRQLSQRFFRYQVIITKFQKIEIFRTPGSNSVFRDILSRNVTVQEYQKQQLQHEKIPREIEFYDEHGPRVTYRNQHDGNPNDSCYDFHPIHCQQRSDNSVLQLHNDGKNVTLNSLRNEFPSTAIQSSTGCFRMGRTINQFRRLCLPSTQSLSLVEASEHTYSSVTSLNTNEDVEVMDELPDDACATTDDDENNLIYEITHIPTVTDSAKPKQLMTPPWENWRFPSKEAANSFWGTSLGYQTFKCKTRWCCWNNRSWLVYDTGRTNYRSSPWNSQIMDPKRNFTRT